MVWKVKLLLVLKLFFLMYRYFMLILLFFWIILLNLVLWLFFVFFWSKNLVVLLKWLLGWLGSLFVSFFFSFYFFSRDWNMVFVINLLDDIFVYIVVLVCFRDFVNFGCWNLLSFFDGYCVGVRMFILLLVGGSVGIVLRWFICFIFNVVVNFCMS